ncbi:dynein heavy chain domain-containing protein 1 [Osmerus mordax]|uniref:dynein heavy chain domain-containing protein 1 n=1 Tax=Osmerus mordax TaxID=8014 RepID=UPI00350EE0D8
MKDPPTGRALSTENLSPMPRPLTGVELPRLVAEVGHETAMEDSLWMDGPGLMASVLATNIPVSLAEVDVEELTVDTAKDNVVSVKKTADRQDKEQKRRAKTISKHKEPLTGTDVVEIFAKQKHLGKLQFFHLQPVDSGRYRPYDLRVVPQSKAGIEYYVFSPTSVLHVRDGCSAGLLSLAEWIHEAVLWNALQDIPLFRDYLLKKAFTRWQRNVRKIALQRRCEVLQGQLLTTVPQFREALFHFCRLIEELKGVHWLPQDDSKTYTLLDFQNTLLKKNQECRVLLEKFLQYRALILNTVQEDSYKGQQELQLRVELAQVNQHSQPLHLQLAHVRDLKKKLRRAEDVLQQLGNMAALVDQMIVQSLVTITQREVLSFLNNVLKVEREQRGCLFEAELIFGADGQLTLFPPMHLFREVVCGALLSVADSALQVFDACSYSSESKDCVPACNSPVRASPELSPDLSLPCSFGKPGQTGPKDREKTEISSLSTRWEPPVELAPRLVLPRLNPLRVQGKRLRGQYYPLCKRHLEWQLKLHSGATEVQEEQDRITQEAQRELQRLCDEHAWLADIHLFTSQWSPASLEAMRGLPALLYEEHIQKVRFWTDRVSTVPRSFTTSNKLLIVHCAHIQEKLGVWPLLTSIEEDVLTFLVGELKLRSQNLIQELKKTVDGLRVEPTDFNDFTQYASMVTRCEKMSNDMQQQLEYMHSLQETIRMIYRQEVALEALMLDLWDCFVPLLKRAAETVRQRLPSMADTLDSTFTSLAQDLEDTISKTTSGPFLDPTQNAGQMLTQLKTVSRHVYAVSARLQELSRTSRSLRGHPLDLTFVTTGQQKIQTRKGLWELLSFSTAQIREWKLLPFSKFLVSRAQGKVDEWLQQAMSLARLIPSQDAVLQKILQTLEHFHLQLPVLAQLSSPTLKHKHWRNIFKGMGQLYSPQWSLTVADLMSKMLVEHQNKISKICREAKAEADMEQAFRKLQRSWEGAQFRLAKFIVTVWQEDKPQDGATRRKKPSTDLESNHASPQQLSKDCGTFTIIGLETLLAQTEDSVMTLSNMLLSPHVAEFRQEVEHWVQMLQELEELLDFCERYQQKWVFLSKMFYETTVCVQKAELFETFQPVDKTFRELIQTTSGDPHVLNIVRLKKVTESNVLFHGDSLRRLLMAGLSTMEGISNQLLYLLDSPRGQFPRLCFLSDGEVIRLLSLHPTPSTLLPLVRKCFRGVRWLEVVSNSDSSRDVTELSRGLDLSGSQMLVQGVYGSLREHVSFLCPLEPNLNSLAWLGLLEQQLYQATRELVKQCAVARQQVEPSDKDLETDRKIGDTSHFSRQSDFLRKKEEMEAKVRENDLPSQLSILPDYPLQCLLVVEEALWCSEVRKAGQAAAPVKWNCLKARNTSKLHSLCQTVRDGLSGASDRSLTSQRATTVLRSLVLLTMNHAQNISKLMEVKGDLESSFEWQSLMKYHVVLDCGDETTQQSQETKDCWCYVEVLGVQLPYGYEYLGPDHWMTVNSPSTDKAILGILLALTSYRCGFVSGPQMSGKKKTVVQLGKALGRQVISFHCCVNTRLSIIQQLLFGALQTGAWLVLDSMDLMTQGALSLLGQHLSDIHQSLSCLQRNTQPKGFESCSEPSFPSSESGDLGRGCETLDELEMCFAGKNIFVKPSYGCVIISSRGYSTDVPENLRAATRPVALAQPDYRVIAEVMLTSLGFSEAVTLSRCLLSLFTLAGNSLCLPDSISGKQTCWLVLLMNVITVAGTHFQNTRRQEVLLKEKELEDEADVQRHSLDVVPKITETEERAREGDSFKFKRTNQSSALIQGVVEEQAIVKGVSSVLVSAIHEQKKASQFRAIFEEIFPTLRSYPVLELDIEEGDRNLLQAAVMEELQQAGLHADPRVLKEVLSLYQAIKLSRAVLMVGPPGSGKTTCYHALAGALRKLAARAEEVDLDDDVSPEGRCSDIDYSPTTSNWSSVDTVVIFPNALSNEELFGGCFQQQEGYWSDGVFTKVLKDSERHDLLDSTPSKRKKRKSQTRKVKWLVMDGEPLGQPGWLDHLSTLCDPDDPFLCLPSAEKVRPSLEELKLLAEVTDLSDAAPSTVTRCTLVHLGGKDLWKSVWKVEVDALSRDHTLDQGTINMWVRLAEDLFSCTLTFLRHKALTPVMHSEADNDNNVSKGIAYGLQEVMSFIRILHALLEQYMAPVVTQPSSVNISTPSTQPELQARNIFLVAYIWGFGGHLHPRHWPQFDVLVREALFESRYRVEVPAEGTVFEYFFNITEGTMGDMSTPISCSRNKSPLMAYITIPQYQKYACLLDLMLEAHQPVLLVGEVGSGKTMLCQSLMNEDRPHIRLIAGPRLRASDLRGVLESMGKQKTPMGIMGSQNKQARHLLFVDDLHKAACDVFGKTSMALETLRQCISRGGVLTSDGYHFKLFGSGAIRYLGTCSTSAVTKPSCNSISSRLLRLFSVLVLPSISVDVLFSIHSPLIQTWLKEFKGMPRYADMTRCIIAATLDLYQSVCEHFLPTPLRPHFLFSQHDLQKVFQGMCLWAPRASGRHPPQKKVSLRAVLSSSALPCFSPTTLGPAANVLNIVRLWMHECLRTFGDRLCSEDESKTLVSLIAQVSDNSYSGWMTVQAQAVGGEETMSSTTPPTFTSSSIIEDPPTSPHQLPASPSQTERDTEALAFTQPTKSPLPGAADEQEEEEIQQLRLSYSGFSLSANGKEDLFDKNKNQEISKKDKHPSLPLPDPASSSLQCLSPSPPKGPKPVCQSDWKRSLRLSEPSSQDDSIHWPGPGSARLVPLQLLQDLKASMCNLVYGPELFEPLASMAQQHNFKRNVSYQERDPGLLLQQLALTVKSKEEGEDGDLEDKYSCTSSYVVHRQRLRQLLHTLRALFLPGGHGVLFSVVKGTGRRTTVRLAAYLTGYQLMEVHPGNERTLRDMLKEAGSQAGVQGNHVMILVHEETSLEHREELLEVMASGTFPGLYSDEELKNLVLKVNALVKNSRSRLRDDQALDKYFKQVQKNMHVFLLLPLSLDISKMEADTASVTQAVCLCCCVEVYQPWSSQTLVEAASRHLKENLQIPDPANRDSLVASISKVMAEIHQSAWKYASVLLPNLQPFSPQTYVELIAHFFHLCSHLYEQGLGQANRVATVLARVRDMTDTAEEYRQEVIKLKNKVAETQQCQYQLQHKIKMEQVLCDRSRQNCLLEENRLSHLEEQFQQAQQQVSPLYQTALVALKSLSQNDLDEVRHYRVPPAGVVIVMDAICMLFNYPCTWDSSKHLLGQSNFCQELEFYDRSRLNGEMFEQLSHIIQRKEFSPQAVKSVSRACESLCRWVRAVYQYACVQRHMAPQEVKKIQLDLRIAESRSRLSVARLQEEETREHIDDIEKELLVLRGEQEELAGLLRKAEALEREASSAVQQVVCHITDWKAAAEETEMNNQTISGDALLLAAAITYLGPFRPDTRMELLRKWRELSLTGNISSTPDDPRTSLLPQSSPEAPPPPLDHVPLPMAAELQMALVRALGVDRYVVQGVPPGLLLKLLTWGNRGPWAQRWPLLADASQREEISSQTMLFTVEDSTAQEEREYGLVVSADDPHLLDKVRQGAEKGLRVLVTHIERAAHTPDFLEMLVRPAGNCAPGLRRPVQPAHPEYCLFLSTCLPVRLLLNEIHPSVLSEVRVIDLSLSTTEVQELLLTELVQLECPELGVQHCVLIQDRQTLHDKLSQEEVSLIEYILQSFTPLLQDPQFLPRVSACQLASHRLQAELADLSQELVRHKPLLADFQRVAALATGLYQALQEVACLSPTYYFPLKTFLLNVRGALALKGRPDVVFAGEVLAGAVMAEITYRMVSHFLAQYRPCLFQSHASLLRLLVSLALFLHSEPCSEVERVAFLKGLGDMDLPVDSSTQTTAPASRSSPSTPQPELPCWLPSHTHTGVLRLENIPPFRGLIASLAASPKQWKEYLRFPSSTLVGPVPCRSHSHLSTLQRALLWKTLLPHWLAAVAEDLAACHLGQPVRSAVPDAPHTGSPEALSRFLSRHEGPVIVTLPSPDREGPASIQPLHWLKQVAQYQTDRKGVKVKIISVGAICQKETILSSLALAVRDGHWLVFNNCHLLEQWDAEVVTHFNQLISVAAKRPSPASQVHPRFRLWFITRGYRPLSIPSAVRVCALRLVCDSPCDVKEELCSSLHQVVSPALPVSASGISASSLEPLLRCAILHSVLLQRQAYRHLGQGYVYHWTQDDLQALVDAYARIAKHCDDKAEALEYIAAQLVYGGHVADSTDLEAVESIARACFQPASPLWGCGPHTLSDIIHIHGRFDVAGLLRGLEHRVRALANTSDPMVLGFSTGLSVELVKLHSRTLNLLLSDSQRPTGRMRSITRDSPHPAPLPDLSQARDRLQALKDSLGHKEESWVVGVSPGPLHSFLQAEWDDLGDLVSSLLSELSQHLSSRWTPSSFPTLTTLSHLEKRAELLSTYLWNDTTSAPNSAYCLSAFSNARGFLAALIREAAKAKQREIINFSLHFQVLSAASCPSAPPLSGVYLCGLELRGALWDTRLGALQDTLSPKPCLLPLLWVRARARNTDVRAPDSPPCDTSSLPLYHCPLYLDGALHNEDWGLTENNIITHVPLVAKLDPVLCSLRRVRLVSTL